jgi:hypothetical protein
LTISREGCYFEGPEEKKSVLFVNALMNFQFFD